MCAWRLRRPLCQHHYQLLVGAEPHGLQNGCRTLLNHNIPMFLAAISEGTSKYAAYTHAFGTRSAGCEPWQSLMHVLGVTQALSAPGAVCCGAARAQLILLASCQHLSRKWGASETHLARRAAALSWSSRSCSASCASICPRSAASSRRCCACRSACRAAERLFFYMALNSERLPLGVTSIISSSLLFSICT